MKQLSDFLVASILELASDVRFHSMVATILLILLSLLLYLFWSGKVSSVFTLFVLGALGGCTSNYLRLRDIAVATAIPPADLHLAILQVYITPVVSGFLAIIMYILVASGAVAGELFPEFDKQSQGQASFISFLWTARPKAPIDSAKVLLWAFVAGFCERLVPSVIDTLVKAVGH